LAVLKNRWAVVSMLLACWALTASFVATYYWLQYNDVQNRIGGITIYISVGADYGNSTRVWYNNTKALTGITLFKVTKDAFETIYDSVAGYGVYVKSINGVSSNTTHGWVWWRFDLGSQSWRLVEIASDSYAVADGETFLWYYETGWPPPPPE